MTTRALLVTDDEQLRKNVAALGPVDTLSLGELEPGTWEAAPLVLLDDRDAEDAVLLGVPRRPALVVLGHDLDDAGVWARAVSVGAEHVLFLPDAADWLTGRLAASWTGARR